MARKPKAPTGDGQDVQPGGLQTAPEPGDRGVEHRRSHLVGSPDGTEELVPADRARPAPNQPAQDIRLAIRQGHGNIAAVHRTTLYHHVVPR